MLRIIYLLLISLNIFLLTAGCDDNDSTTSGDGKYISGVAATGAPAADTLVTLTDKDGETRSTTSDSDGAYAIEITGLTAPYVIWFEAGSESIYATDCGSERVNINPFSDVVTHLVNSQAGGEGTPDASILPEGECDIAQNQVKQIISPVLALYGVDESLNLMAMEGFSADGFGLDGIFDDFNMKVNGGNFVFSSKIDNSPIISIMVEDITAPDDSVEDVDMTEVITLRMLNNLAEKISFEDFGGDNTSASLVSSNLDLFTLTRNKASASWEISDTSVISSDGVVTIPDSSENVTLTLTLSKNGYSVTKVFTLTVPNLDGDDGVVASAVSALTFDTIKGSNTAESDITSNLSLPESGTGDTTISWSSSDLQYITDSGTVDRSAVSGCGASVTLTATITKNTSEDTKDFNLTVPSLDAVSVADAVSGLTFDTIKASNSAESGIVADLDLSTSGSCGTTVSWSSTDTSLIGNDGGVLRYITGDKSATVTATVSKGSEQDTKDFSLTITAAPVSSLSIMSYYTLAISEANDLWNWGYNVSGQLGDGTTTDASEPQLLPEPFNDNSILQDISVTSEHTMALKNDGTLWAWGENSYGEIGDGTTNNALVPVQVGTASDWAKIYATNYNSFGIKTDGTLWAWGRNDRAQLGDGTTTNSTVPKQFGSDTDWDYIIGVYEHFIGVKTDGTAYIWGWNGNAQIGDGTTTDVDSPALFGSITDWKSIALGYRHTVGVKTDGTLWAWGGNFNGEYGNGTTTSSATAVQVGTDTDWSKVYAGEGYTFIEKTDGSILCTGSGVFGRLGIGSVADQNTFQTFGSTTDWSTLYIGFSNAFGIKTDGTVWAWGGNSNGQLGDGTTTNQLSPVQVFPRP